MIDVITFFDNNQKLTIYIGWGKNRLYHFLEMMVVPTVLNTSVQIFHQFWSFIFHQQCYRNSTDSHCRYLRSTEAFLNAAEELDTRLVPASYVALTSSNQIL